MPHSSSNADGGASNRSQKRKEPAQTSDSSRNHNEKDRAPKRVKVQNARTILTQTSDAALSNGELDIQAFLKAREFEIKALEDGMRRSKGTLAMRAFQQVPRDMRRRTASHNVKRVPKRLQKRAAREMKEDNTPTVTANKRKPGSSRGRLRAETARKLGLLSQKKKASKTQAATAVGIDNKSNIEGIIGRAPRPKTRKGALKEPPKPTSKFRKRQIPKTWLPTHMYHAKRAKMTEPKKPLWRFAIPLTPTEKSYRPTHRAGGGRGALCWDTSYISTIGLEGPETSLEKVLKAVGVTQEGQWGNIGRKWREGRRSWSGWLSRDQNGQRREIGPATVIWCYAEPASTADLARDDIEQTKKLKKPPPLQLFIRVHPAAFLELWDELLQLSKMQRPLVHVEDLRFEIGSIEMTGPGSTEALLGILHTFDQSTNVGNEGQEKPFKALAGVTNAASLPPNALLTLSIMDPRLRYPSRKVDIPKPDDEQAAFSLLETLATWPADQSSPSTSIFDRDSRFKATRLQSQKSLNRRKGLAPPGEYPPHIPADQPIPVLLYVSRSTSSSTVQGTWTLLAPWKCILPIWYVLMHYPLSSGSNPRFGGLQELQQIHFEHGKPWFPVDYPGTDAGWAWERDERQRRKQEWDKRPKGKRTEFESLDLGDGRKGEIGLGWACDFERLMKPGSPPETGEKTQKKDDSTSEKENSSEKTTRANSTPSPFQHLSAAKFLSLLSNAKLDIPPASLATVRITLFSRGVPLPCARIYRLPSNHPLTQSASSPTPPQIDQPHSRSEAKSAPTSPSLREQWLSLAPFPPPSKSTTNFKTRTPQGAKTKTTKERPLHTFPPSSRHRVLAQSLLQTPPLQYPAEKSSQADSGGGGYPIVPGEEDLIGFVTTGGFNLAEGKGVGVGSVIVGKVLGGMRKLGDEQANGDEKEGRGGGKGEGRSGGGGKGREARMCIVRNAGERVGRLGIWDVV